MRMLAAAMLVATACTVAAGTVAAGTAAAQQLPHISMHADSDVYGPGQTIRVSGLVGGPHGGAVTIQVLSPGGAVVAVGQVMPDGRDWSWSMPAEFGAPGTYTMTAHYALAAGHGRPASVTFVYDSAVEGAVAVNGTMFEISYAGDPILAARTDAHSSLLYVELAGPGAGVMRLPGGLHEGALLAVDGGSVEELPDGSYAYAADSAVLVLAADAVAVPEFGGAAVLVSALAASAALPLAGRLRR